jgi:hypothetical protein
MLDRLQPGAIFSIESWSIEPSKPFEEDGIRARVRDADHVVDGKMLAVADDQSTLPGACDSDELVGVKLFGFQGKSGAACSERG